MHKREIYKKWKCEKFKKTVKGKEYSNLKEQSIVLATA